MIIGIVLGVIAVLGIIYLFTINGIYLCKRNNAVGVFLLFIGLNIFGLLLGCCLLYNAKSGMYDKPYKSLITNVSTDNKALIAEENKNSNNTIANSDK